MRHNFSIQTLVSVLVISAAACSEGVEPPDIPEAQSLNLEALVFRSGSRVDEALH